MNLLVLAVIFATPITAGALFGLVGWWWERRRLAAAFRHGRDLNVVRFPMPVEPLPQLTRRNTA